MDTIERKINQSAQMGLSAQLVNVTINPGINIFHIKAETAKDALEHIHLLDMDADSDAYSHDRLNGNTPLEIVEEHITWNETGQYFCVPMHFEKTLETFYFSFGGSHKIGNKWLGNVAIKIMANTLNEATDVMQEVVGTNYCAPYMEKPGFVTEVLTIDELLQLGTEIVTA